MLHKNQLRPCMLGCRVVVMLALLAVAFFASPALAEENGLAITVERLHGIGVGINIVFPEGVSANLSIILNGKKMDCELVAPNTLYCIGSLRPNETVAIQTFDGASMSVLYTTYITGPDVNEPPDPIYDPCLFLGEARNQQGGFKLASPSPIAIICLL